jgi:hypothetical protein
MSGVDDATFLDGRPYAVVIRNLFEVAMRRLALIAFLSALIPTADSALAVAPPAIQQAQTAPTEPPLPQSPMPPRPRRDCHDEPVTS